MNIWKIPQRKNDEVNCKDTVDPPSGQTIEDENITHNDHPIPVIIEDGEAGTFDTNEESSHHNERKDLSFLSSANFSTESLGETTVTANASQNYNSTYNSYNSNTFQFSNTPMSPPAPRRYSNSSLSNSPVLAPPSSASHNYNQHGTRARPKSAFLMDSINSISEDGSENKAFAFSNTARSRNSVTMDSILNYTNNNRSPSPSRSTSPVRLNKHYRSKSPIRRSSSPKKITNPFNFQSQEMFMHNNGSNQSLQVKPAHRKGHKYKHSSISMNLFQEPPPPSIADKQLKAIPDSYPIPTYKEAFGSITKNQKWRLVWASSHVVLSIIVFVVGFKFKISSLSTVAHLVFYDSLGSLFIVLVDIMSNFEVWNNASIAYPFGLERIEVLVSFALSASLVMLSFDLFSHFVEEFVLTWVSHEDHENHEHLSHHIHDESNHDNTNWVVYQAILFITLTVSLISSNFILAYDRINEMLQVNTNNTKITNPFKPAEKKKNLDLMKIIKVWKNYPTHLITITYVIFLMIVPLIPQSFIKDLAYDVNKCATSLVASLILYNGWYLVKSLGGILLCSFPYSDYQYDVLISKINQQILSLDFFKQDFAIEKLFITKFSYKLYVIGVNVKMKGADSDEEVRMRFEINRIIENEVKKLDNTRESNIEITIDIDRF
ncbi:ZRG17 [Candida pseudojiufengensis]|uniref:ZRG17 n=1 Tax=Candida pseudojiufengensis TaxID=497109 RepID=UPI0022245AF2|nr:ZRG17 [Candida pseudojiufengensis]KAI5959416.1 ZRG17 [Candida pseudojiufengensis]